MRTLFALVAVILAVVPAAAGGVTGQYVEARTCDVWTGACYANSEMNLSGKHAVIAWKIDKGSQDQVGLDGLSVVAVVEASDTLGLKQRGPAKAVLLVDDKADAKQRKALVKLAQRLGGDLTKNVVQVEAMPINVTLPCCKGNGCAVVETKVARVETRCLDPEGDKICGHEDGFYPALTSGAVAQPAAVKEHSYKGNAFNATWTENQRRGAYVGTFKLAD